MGTIAWFGYSKLSFGDARDYVGIAETLAQTGSYPEKTAFYFVRAPGYPVFLAIATMGHPRVVWLAKTVNALLGAAACVLLTLLSARTFRSQTVATATGIAAAVHPAFLRISSDVQSEPLFLVLLLLFAFFLLAAVDRPSGGLALIAGAFLGLAALTRPSGLCLAPLLLSPLFDRRWPGRIRAQISAAAFAGLFTAVAPWTVRNAVVYRELIPINDALGNAFYTGNSDMTIRYYGLESSAEIDAWTVAFDREVREKIARLDAAGITSPSGRSKAFFRAAIEERRGDLAGWARLLGRKALDWLRPWPNPGFWPTPVVWGVGALYVLLYLLAARGLWTAPRHGVAAFAAAALALSMVFHVLVLVVWRYRVPFWDPVLLLYGVAAAADLAGPKPAPQPRVE